MANEKIEIGVKVDIAQAQADLDALAETIRQLNESGDDNEEVVKRLTKQWDKQNAALERAKRAMEATANVEKKVGKGIEDVGKSADASKDAMDALTSVLALAGVKGSGFFGILSRGKIAFDAIKKAVDAFKKSQLAANATMNAGAKSAKLLGNSLKALGKATAISAAIGLAFEGVSKLIEKISSLTKKDGSADSFMGKLQEFLKEYEKTKQNSSLIISALSSNENEALPKILDEKLKANEFLYDTTTTALKEADAAYEELNEKYEYQKKNRLKTGPFSSATTEEVEALGEKVNEYYKIAEQLRKESISILEEDYELRFQMDMLAYNQYILDSENKLNSARLKTTDTLREELDLLDAQYNAERANLKHAHATEEQLNALEERYAIMKDTTIEEDRIKKVNDYYDWRIELRNSQLVDLGKTIDELQGNLDDLASSEISTDEEVAAAKKELILNLEKELELNKKLAEIEYLRIKNTSKDSAEIKRAGMAYETNLKSLQSAFENARTSINSVLSGEEILRQAKIDEVLGHINDMETKLRKDEKYKNMFLPPLELNKKLYDEEAEYYKWTLDQKLITKAQHDDAMRLLDLKYHRDWKSLTSEEKDFYVSSMLDIADAASSIFDSIGDMQDTDSRRGFETQKKMQAASTIVNTLSGVVAAISAAQSIPPPYGQIIGAANAAAVMAAGVANLKQINATKFGQNSMSSNIDVKSSSDKINETIIQRSIGVNEQDNTQVVLVLSDIEAKQREASRVRVSSEV